MWRSLPGLVVSLLVIVAAGAETLVDSFPSPADEPRGLAWDGEYLWCADAETDSFYKLDSSTGTIIGGILSPLAINPEYGGIACSNDGNIWFANGQYVYKLDSATGAVLSSFSCPGG
jgi:DNA-binding beta-propeller fold protein YncE